MAGLVGHLPDERLQGYDRAISDDFVRTTRLEQIVMAVPPVGADQPRWYALPFFRSSRRCRCLHRLDDFEAFEFGVPEIERLVGAGIAMGAAERFRSGPCLEIGPAPPDRVRRIKSVVLAIRAAQQVEFDKPGDVAQMGVARRPYLLELRLGSGNDLEAVHRDKHRHTVGLQSARSCYIAAAAFRPLPPALRSPMAGNT